MENQTQVQPTSLGDSQIKVYKQFANIPIEIQANYDSACTLAKKDYDEILNAAELNKQMLEGELNIFKEIITGCKGLLQYPFIGDANIARRNTKLNKWLKIAGNENVRLLISIVLNWINELSNLRDDKKLSDNQIKVISETIVTHHCISLGICEIIYLCFQGIGGKYGPHYDSLDITTILKWIGKYKQGDIEQTEIENESLKDGNDLTQIAPETQNFLMRFSNSKAV